MMLNANAPQYSSFAAAFSSVVGPHAVAELSHAVAQCAQPIILIAGDQCTGKGTAAEGLVSVLGGQNSGTGTVLRAMAKENDLSIEQMSALLSGARISLDNGQLVALSDFPHLGTAKDVDVKLDFRAAHAIASSKLQKSDGTTLDLTVFESRLAGHLGQYLEDLGRKNVISVYLYASPKVQAERYLEREVLKPAEAAAGTGDRSSINSARDRARAVLAGLSDDLPLGTVLQALATDLQDVGIKGLDTLQQKIAGIAGRDDNDRSRLYSLYGVNYQDRSVFDVVIDTNGKSPAEVQQAILAAVAQKTAPASA